MIDAPRDKPALVVPPLRVLMPRSLYSGQKFTMAVASGTIPM